MLKAMGKLEEERAKRLDGKPEGTKRLSTQQESPPRGTRETLPRGITNIKRIRSLKHDLFLGPTSLTSSRPAKLYSNPRMKCCLGRFFRLRLTVLLQFRRIVAYRPMQHGSVG